MQLKKLDISFYDDHTHLVQALDLVNGNWIHGKERGYGVVCITFNSLTFAIPLRSNIRHDDAYLTVKQSKTNSTNKGLDYSKALLITDQAYLSDNIFKIPSQEHEKLKEKEHFITKAFEKYVLRYVYAFNKSDSNILRNYRFSTLQNYHTELGLKNTSDS